VLAADRVVLRAGGVTVAEASLASLLAQPAIDDELPAWTRPLVRPDGGVVAELAIEKLEVSRSGGGAPQALQLTAVVIWRQRRAVRR
jgi:hypothetical protein